MRKYASAEESAAKKQKTTIRHFGFTEKVYGLPCTVRTMLLWKRHHRIAIVRISFFFTGRHSSGSSPKAGCLCSYIYKEELKTVVREFLACTQPNRHETSTALWNPYRRVSLRGDVRTYASAEERAAKNQKTTVRHFGFTEKVYGLPCTVRTILLWKRHHRNAIVRLSFIFFTGGHSSGSSPKAGYLC